MLFFSLCLLSNLPSSPAPIVLGLEPTQIFLHSLNRSRPVAISKVAKLDLGLESGELDGVVHANGMSAVQDGLPRLLVQKVELDGISGVDVGVAVEVLALEQQDFRLDDALLTQRPAMVHPVDWTLGWM